MAKIKDIAGGFYNNNTIYSPNGYTQARKITNDIIDHTIADMHNEIQQGENFGAEARKNKADKVSIAGLTSNIKKNIVKVSPLPSKKEVAAKQNKSIKTETLVNPDTVPSGATAKQAVDAEPGTKNDPDAKYGHKANESVPGPDLPEAKPGLFEDQQKAEEKLKEARSERDEFIETARQDKKTAKRNMREQSITPDDFDLDDEFDSTDPFIASLFKKGKINKLLKDQIKEQYPDQIAEITDRIKNDPDNADLSGKEVRKLINAEVKKFVEPLWKETGGDTQVNRVRLSTPIAATIKKMMEGSAHESVSKVMNDKRAALEKKQNRSLKDQMFLDAFNMIEKGIDTEKKTAELKGEVKNARNDLTNINAEVRAHESAVDKARGELNKGGRKSRTDHKNGWYFTHTSGDGRATQYASRAEDRDGKKMFVTYSVTAGSPDTQRDPVRIADYQEYQGERDPNIMGVENFAEGRLDQIEGGFKGKNEAITNAKNKQDFESLDGKDYFKYSKAHKVIAPKIMKLISDLGGKIDRSTGKIYTTSVADFPEGADELYIDYGTALKLAKGSDEEVAKLTGMSLKEVKDRRVAGMVREYRVGDAHVVIDDQGRAVYQFPEDNKTVLSGAKGRSFYINWNEPHNRKVVEKYAKMGMTKQDIPLSELKTVNTSRSSEGNIDWTDKKKTSAAEKEQMANYTGAYKPSKDILDALIGFGNKNKPLE